MFEFIFEIILIPGFSYPGAGFIWLISRTWKSKKAFKEIRKENLDMNSILGVFIVASPIIIYNLL
ncbi:hypothetical protein [Olleya sp. YS]|uniref:hypothetical protein n=1 Tax=Olleya sp. YS TaxID=3028318 RepID=UPI0024341C77|nr:hypothetical protein [Olleya sp. YS]WGD34215.1 hypothetical protein Ollyesu_10550 [Olleya sp. YS]